MLDLFTYFIYLSLLATLIFVTSYKQKFITAELEFGAVQKLRLQHFAALILFSLIIGFRHNVGVDWESYKLNFELLKDSPLISFNEQKNEIAFFYINKIIIALGLGFQWMFFTMAMITWYFYFKSLPKFLLPLLLFFLFVDEYFFWSMNGVRQFVAMGIWLFSTRYILNKKLFKYVIFILIASLFHRSALVLLPLYFLPYTKIHNRYFWLVLFVITFFIGNINFLLDLIKPGLQSIGQKVGVFEVYNYYLERDQIEINTDVQLGLGYIFKLLVNAFLIIVSSLVIKKHPKTSLFFVLFFIGTIFFNLFYSIQLLGRINNYFLIMRSVVIAISIWYFWKTKEYRIYIYLFCLLYFIIFLVSIYNSSNLCSPFRFTFQL